MRFPKLHCGSVLQRKQNKNKNKTPTAKLYPTIKFDHIQKVQKEKTNKKPPKKTNKTYIKI